MEAREGHVDRHDIMGEQLKSQRTSEDASTSRETSGSRSRRFPRTKNFADTEDPVSQRRGTSLDPEGPLDECEEPEEWAGKLPTQTPSTEHLG